MEREIPPPSYPVFYLNGAIAVAIVAFETLLRWVAFPVVGSISFLGIGVLLTTVLTGIRGRWGVAIGALFTGAIGGNWSVGIAVSIAGFISTTVCALLWETPKDRTVRWRIYTVGVAVITVTVLTATKGLLLVLFGYVPFGVVTLQSFLLVLPPTIAGLPLVWLANRRGVGLRFPPLFPRVSRRSKQSIGAIALLWAVGSYTLSFVFEALDTVPIVVVGQRLGPVVRAIIEVTRGGRLLVLLLGFSAIAVIGIIAVRDRDNWYRTATQKDANRK